MDIAETIKNIFIGKIAGIVEYYKNNEIKWETNSRLTTTFEFPTNSTKHFILRQYRKNGELYIYSEYKKNVKHGKYIINYPSGNKKVSKFKDGKVVISTEYFSNGKIKKRSNYNNGRLNGECTEFYDNGYLKEKKFYKKGRLNGLYQAFYKDGILECEANFLNDRMHGTTTYYSKKSKKIKEIEHSHGWHKKTTYFNENGQVDDKNWDW